MSLGPTPANARAAMQAAVAGIHSPGSRGGTIPGLYVLKGVKPIAWHPDRAVRTARVQAVFGDAAVVVPGR